ncbi:type II secretion system F family protein [Parafrankia discariae]|uniref:type II secretion system F family protein n=1 Tax=Parafrankia discariae TaxID=365528 RepID=UPI0003665886|nr:type II secretion system F family protein [Parafrankia discariae]
MTGLPLACGIATGIGLWLLWTALRPSKPDLHQLIADLHPTPPTPDQPATPAGRWAARAGRPLARRLTPGQFIPASISRDIVSLDRDPATHLAEKISSGVVGFFLLLFLAVVLAVGGVRLPVVLPAAGALVLAAVGFLAPDLAVRADAAAHRRALRAAFSAFLDLVVIALAGGAGVEQALDDAASIGTGPAYTQLRRAVDTAVLTGTPIWTTLADLGHRHTIPDIVETAASVELAGGEGAKIRASLAAKATSIRLRALTDADADAAAATERMSLPVALLFLGFLLLIGYPAVARVMTSL